MNTTVSRNAFGRQRDSFEVDLNIRHIGYSFGVFLFAVRTLLERTYTDAHLFRANVQTSRSMPSNCQ
ncbi:MAG: hypothetical protein LOD88_07950 [Novibacillus thermophilus]|uniref:Uncharacterized protein n=1 Tax=Novibacillus thermophilus TaxID=1471761 RepID=A0A1U9K3M3_9BACL|nr:hypothetical protein [Novibacillus thermophilus]AQS54620.1 hypothetical protein B0W44_01295 [Novibacillus thermophilus]